MFLNIKSSTIYQYYATFCVNLIAVVYGIVCGWPSPNFPILQSEQSPLDTGPLSEEELSWINSIMFVGGLTGTFFFGWVTDRLGRKYPLCFIAIPFLASWLLIFFAANVIYLYVARFLAGISGGGVFVLIPLYVSEISEDEIRGALGTKLLLCTNFGILFSFICGEIFCYKTSLIIYGSLPIIFLLGTFFLPETPVYLMKKNHIKQAEASLKYFRNIRSKSVNTLTRYNTEIDKIKKEVKIQYCDARDSNIAIKVEWKDFFTPIAIKANLLGIGLVALNQFCGALTMISYTATIFHESGSNFTPNISAIIIGFIVFFGSYASSFFVDRMGRKFLLISSAVGAGIGLCVLSGYGYATKFGYDLSEYNWIPLVSFSEYMFVVALGVTTIPVVVIAEIMPEKIRSISLSMCMGLIWLFACFSTKYFYQVVDLLEIHGCMLLFAMGCFSGALFVFFLIPETKGKSFAEIQALL